MRYTKAMRFLRRFWSLLVTLLVFGFIVTVWLQRQAIYDYLRLRNYHPDSVVVQLATDTTMNAKARNIFYVQHPELDTKTNFNGHCSNGEQTIVLGCYISRTGIYVLQVDDSRLAGIEQVTAAHEMLHAAYDRLGSKDKQNVDDLITQTYAKVTDQRIRDTIDQYKKAGADTTNELHSILGTEVHGLPPALETYYKRYFTDRTKIVSYSEQYEQAFTDSKTKVDEDDVQLKQMKIQIDSDQSALSTQSDDLASRRAKLDQERSSGDINSYNAGVAPYNTAVRAYNNLVIQTKNEIDVYNTLLDARNALAIQEQSLFQAIDSHLTTQQSK
jgi:hypothetical protein